MWLLGTAMGINHLLFGVGWMAVKQFLPLAQFAALFALTPSSPEDIMPMMPSAWPAPEALFVYAIVGLTAVFIWSILFWAIVTIAEGALIATVRDAEKGERVHVGTALKAGWQWLARFAAVDALIFFPWFLLALTLMVIGGAVLIATLASFIAPGADIEQVAVAGFGGLLCLFPVLMVMGLLTSLTVWYRTLAFRDAALLDHGIKTAVRHPLRLIKANMSGIIGVTALLWGVMSVISGSITIISFSSAFFIHGGAWPFMLLELTAVVLATLLNGILLAFQSAIWTIAYQEWADNIALSDTIVAALRKPSLEN